MELYWWSTIINSVDFVLNYITISETLTTFGTRLKTLLFTESYPDIRLI